LFGFGDNGVSELRNVVGVLDMDGFCIGERFYCKELGIWRVGSVYADSYFFFILVLNGANWMKIQGSSVVM
jgi:hypothetical protein